MNDFSDPDSPIGEWVFQGAPEHPIDDYCNTTVIAAMNHWLDRDNLTQPMPELLHIAQTRSFVITYRGESGQYWPNKADNYIAEALIREFLFRDGICQLQSDQPTFYAAHYKVLALQETEFLLVLPYPTEAQNMAGVVVVCVNRQLRADAPNS